MQDSNILCVRGRFTILAAFHEVALKDGSITKLHRVIEGKNTEPARFLRAYLHPDAGIFIVDLGELAKPLQKELRQCLPRDMAGTAQYVLRQFFANFATLRVAMVENAQASFPAIPFAGPRAKLDKLRGTWDGKARMGTWLRRLVVGEDGGTPAYIPPARRTLYLDRVGTWLLMGMVARAMQPGCPVHHMTIFEEPQGVGKSMLARLLGDAWFAGAGQQLDSTSAAEHLERVWVYEFCELDALSRREIGALKQFITQSHDRFRAPFDVPSEKPRRCVFVGTTADIDAIGDIEGDRRFWPVHVSDRIALATIKMELDQMLAEALHYYEAGVPYNPTYDDMEAIFGHELAGEKVAA